MSDKREYPRESTETGIELAFRDKKVSCTVANISRAGAFIEVRGNEVNFLSQDHVGDEVTLYFGSPGEISVKKGIIMRFEAFADAACLAVYFRNV